MMEHSHPWYTKTLTEEGKHSIIHTCGRDVQVQKCASDMACVIFLQDISRIHNQRAHPATMKKIIHGLNVKTGA